MSTLNLEQESEQSEQHKGFLLSWSGWVPSQNWVTLVGVWRAYDAASGACLQTIVPRGYEHFAPGEYDSITEQTSEEKRRAAVQDGLDRLKLAIDIHAESGARI